MRLGKVRIPGLHAPGVSASPAKTVAGNIQAPGCQTTASLEVVLQRSMLELIIIATHDFYHYFIFINIIFINILCSSNKANRCFVDYDSANLK
jgi:hypothetical protein